MSMKVIPSHDTIIKHLMIAKKLYHLGLDYSYMPESTSYVLLLHFHDAVEIFLKLSAENANVKADKVGFIEYWTLIPSLTLKEAMNQLNIRRNNLKHKAILPAKLDLEVSRVNVTNFFNENTIMQFGFNFSDVSLFKLINNSEISSLLKAAQDKIDSGDFEESIDEITKAFVKASDITNLGQYRKKYRRLGGISANAAKQSFLAERGSEITELTKFFNDKIKALEKELEIISLGIDYRRYIKFKLFCSDAFLTPNNEVAIVSRKKVVFNKANIQFCLDFVLDYILRIQDFELDIESLVENSFFLKI